MARICWWVWAGVPGVDEHDGVVRGRRRDGEVAFVDSGEEGAVLAFEAIFVVAASGGLGIQLIAAAGAAYASGRVGVEQKQGEVGLKFPQSTRWSSRGRDRNRVCGRIPDRASVEWVKRSQHGCCRRRARAR